MRILLVNPAPPYNPDMQPYVTFPNGLLYLAAVLEKAGHQVQVYDGNIDSRNPEDFVAFKPSLIGFALVTSPNISD
ncbi:MAG: cobalamin-dependent protein, partial [Anaerolineales bacterium]|nr:cobalamin-dependent protein [Anaerolineales bacterium]